LTSSNFNISSAGTATIAASQSYTGAGAVTLSSAAANNITIDPAGSGTAAINIGGTNATSVVLGRSSQTLQIKSLASIAANGVLYLSDTSGTVAETAASTGAQCLQTASSGSAPIWGSCGGGGSTLQTAYTASTGGSTSEIILDATRGALDIQDRSTSNGGTIGANLLNVRATAATDSTAGTLLFGIGNTGAATFQNSANSAAAFAVNNSGGQSVINVSTSNSTDNSTNNLANNPSVETAPSSSDWVLKGTATIAQDSTVAYYGANSLKITSAAANDGAFDKLNTTLTASTIYNLLLYVKSNNTTNATVQAGYSINASAESILCTNSVTVTVSGWTRYSCSFTTPASGETSSNAIFIKTTSPAAPVINVDAAYVQLSSSAASAYSEGSMTLQGTITSPVILQDTTNENTAFSILNASGGQVLSVDTTDTNLLNNPANPSFEVNTTGWTLHNGTSGTTTIARDTSQQKYGIASLLITADAHSGNGARYTLASGSWAAGSYTVSFSMLNSGTAFAAVPFVQFYNGSDNNCNTVTPSTLPSTAGWIRYAATCTFSGTTTGIDIEQNEATAHTFYIDAVQLETGSVATTYGLGAISLSGQIITPLQLKNQSNSTTSLQLQDTSGNTLVNVDTQGDIISLGSTGAQALATTINVGSSTGAAQTVSLGSTSTTSATSIVGGASGSINIGSVGSSTLSSAIHIQDTSNATGTQTVVIGNSNNASNAVTIEAGNTGKIQIGNGATAHTIQIGANASGAQIVSIGNAVATSSLTLTAGSGNMALNTTSGTITLATATSGNIILQPLGSGTTGNVQIGAGNGGSGSTTPDLLALDVSSSSSDPTAVNGGMYYNASSNTFRCAVSGAWENCIGGILTTNTTSTAQASCTTACGPVATATSAWPANYCVANRVIHINVSGVWGSSSTAPTLTLGVYLGTSATKASDTLVGVVSNTTTMTASVSAQAWDMDIYINCVSTTTVFLHGSGIFSSSATTGASQAMKLFETAVTGTVTTSASNIYIFPAWGASSSSNTITGNQIIVQGM
jgi:hypothetical protein